MRARAAARANGPPESPVRAATPAYDHAVPAARRPPRTKHPTARLPARVMATPRTLKIPPPIIPPTPIAVVSHNPSTPRRDAMMKRIRGELRDEIRADVRTNIARRGGAETLMISRYQPDPSLEGQRLYQIALENARSNVQSRTYETERVMS